MRTPAATVLLSALVAVLTAAAGAQQPQFRTETTIVQIDVVVRDDTGQPIEDLDEDDFEVLENGIAQPIVWFEQSDGALVADRAGESDTAQPRAWGQTGPTANGNPQSLVALVFHQLDPKGRAPATRAAGAMIERLPAGDFAAVYVIDQAMTPLTGFTRDREALRKAIHTVAMTPPADTGPSWGGGVAESGGNMAGSSRSDQSIAAMRGRMADGERRMFAEYAAGAEGAALSELIADLDRFPGRRSVIFFSGGFTMPMAATRLEHVVDKAAPSHVSFYTVVPSGLATGAPRTPSARHLDGSELTSVSTETGRRPTRIAETDITRGLRPLAELTGGLYLADSNDIDGLLGRANADRRTFYVLGYRTSAPAAEAGTRPIEVRVSRPDVNVRARTRIGQAAQP